METKKSFLLPPFSPQTLCVIYSNAFPFTYFKIKDTNLNLAPTLRAAVFSFLVSMPANHVDCWWLNPHWEQTNSIDAVAVTQTQDSGKEGKTVPWPHLAPMLAYNRHS